MISTPRERAVTVVSLTVGRDKIVATDSMDSLLEIQNSLNMRVIAK